MKKVVIPPVGAKDVNGAFIKEPGPKLPDPAPAPSIEPTDQSIDSLMARGLTIIDRTLRTVMMNASSDRGPSRNDVMNLKDCMMLLRDLKAEEQDILDKMSPEDLLAVLIDSIGIYELEKMVRNAK